MSGYKEKIMEVIGKDLRCSSISLTSATSGQYPSRCNVCGGGIPVFRMKETLLLKHHKHDDWAQWRRYLIENDLCSLECHNTVWRIEELRTAAKYKTILEEGDRAEYKVPWHPDLRIRLSLEMDYYDTKIWENPRSWEKDIREQAYFNMLMDEYNREHGERCRHCKHYSKGICCIRPPEVFQQAREFGESSSHSESSGWSALSFGKTSGSSSSSSKWNTEFSYSSQQPSVAPYSHPCKEYTETRKVIPAPPVKPVFIN